MLTNIINTIGMEKFAIILAIAIPLVFFILTDLILIRKNFKNLHIKTFISQNKLGGVVGGY